ncbi:MAG: sulfite exporter TauE/SafE family protein [Burkholderiales bacterium]
MLTDFSLGLLIGVIMALTGAGGGILAVPLLVFGAHLSMAQAGPVGLLAVGMAAALGASLGLRAGMVRYRAALLMSVMGMACSPVGLWLAYRANNRWLTILFSFILLFVAYRTFRQTGKQPAHLLAERNPLPCVRDSSGRFLWTSQCVRTLGIFGCIAGLLSGLLGVGGGFVLVPALKRYSDLEIHSVVATSLAVIALVSATGVVSSIVVGNLDWPVAIPFSAGALAGMTGGRLAASRLPEPHLQKGFAIVAALVAAGMIAKIMM